MHLLDVKGVCIFRRHSARHFPQQIRGSKNIRPPHPFELREITKENVETFSLQSGKSVQIAAPVIIDSMPVS
jgi:hypothetical protein